MAEKKTPTPPQTTSEGTTPDTPPEPTLGEKAFEAEQQLARARALISALADAQRDDSDVRYALEGIGRLLDPVQEHLSDLTWELTPTPQEDQP
jgi:hypothetical protein